MIVAKELFLTTGVGCHAEELASFELALRDAQISAYNIVSISSIVPPNCEIINMQDGITKLEFGQILFTVLARSGTNEPGRWAHAAVGCALPENNSMFGYLSEVHGLGRDKKLGERAEDLAAGMLAGALGIQDFDVDKSWDDARSAFRFNGGMVQPRSISIEAESDGLWTTVLAAAVMVI